MSVIESPSAGQEEQACSILPVDPYEIAPKPDWSEPEKWVWQQLCQGKIADFNRLYGELDPKTPNCWSETRVITPSFLETILTAKPYQSALPRQGVRIIGALIRQEIDLENGSICHQWWLEESELKQTLSYSS